MNLHASRLRWVLPAPALAAILYACGLNPQQLPPVAGEGTGPDSGSQTNNPPPSGGAGDSGAKTDASSDDGGVPREGDAGDASAAGATTDAGDAGDAGEGGGASDAATDKGGDASTSFPDALPGIWLIGWSGGLNHYSWVRFNGNAVAPGSADYLPGADIPANAPYWNCSGTGTWSIAQMPKTVVLTFPSACGLSPAVLTFNSFSAPTGYPANATLAASMSAASLGQPLDGWRLPPSQCDAQMTMCTSPL